MSVAIHAVVLACIFGCEPASNPHMPALPLHLLSDQFHIGTAAAAAIAATAVQPVLLICLPVTCIRHDTHFCFAHPGGGQPQETLKSSEGQAWLESGADALSMFSESICMQEAAGDAVYTMLQQFCMQKAAGDAVYTISQQLCRQKAAGDAVSAFSMQCCMQEAAEEALSLFSQHLNTQYTANMTAKLGLQKYDKDIAAELLTNMYEDKTGVQQSLKAASAQPSPAAKCRAAVHALLLSTVWRQPWCRTEHLVQHMHAMPLVFEPNTAVCYNNSCCVT